MAGNWDDFKIPFERQELTPWTPGPADVLAGAVVVLSTLVEVPTVGPSPGLVFRFVDAAGEFMPAVLLLLEDQAMADLVPLVPLITEAVAAAREAATAARGTS